MPKSTAGSIKRNAPGRARAKASARKNRLGIQSVEVASAILRALIDAGRAVPLRELARRAGMHPGKTHRYLVSLVRTELLSQDPVSGHYGFGPLALAVGLGAMREVDVFRCAAELLPRLRDEIDETVMLLIWGADGPLVYHFEESARPVFMNVRIGSTVPMLRTAAGQVFGAFLPRSRTGPILERERRALSTSGQALDERSTEQAFEAARRTNLASVEGNLLPGVSALASAVFDHRGRIAAVIGALGRSEEMDISPEGRMAAAVLRTAGEISRRLGYSNQPAHGQQGPDALATSDQTGRAASPQL